ncbi:MAG TPA: succinate dehydrogenase [Thermodesulfobacteriota bacterium]|nr:succinate dehydrogenase [Thermodesulfobacteriota bacterium]
MGSSASQNYTTLRTDNWKTAPMITAAVLGSFVLYATWRALENQYYLAEPYLSPFYSPLINPEWWPLSPAILILWAPGLFRFTCYYYRKAYYRSFAGMPPGCAVEGRSKESYNGESKFPLILQNLHRFFFYAATIVLIFLWYDAYKGFKFEDGYGVGIGSVVLVINAFLLSMYSLSCHSFRHLIGGKLNIFSACPTRFSLWKGASSLNENHMLWAWLSLFGVCLTDLYVRLVATGVINDVRFI